jgi:tetratricopeptide (TPR) repeat protein
LPVADLGPDVEPVPADEVAEPAHAGAPTSEPEPASGLPDGEPVVAGADEVFETVFDEDVQAVPLEDDDDAAMETPTVALPAVGQPLDAALLARRREILEMFQSLPLKNHFEVLGIEPGCDDAEVRRAYVSLAKRYHPDARRDPLLEDMHDILEAIFIRVGEAWEVLGESKSRASYEARSGIVRRPRPSPPAAAPPATATSTASAAASDVATPAPPPPSAPAERREYVPPEEILYRARLLLAQARYWDAIQVLESALPGMEPRSQQHRGRLLLARAYSKNPNWLRRAEETLHDLMREDPTNADAHYELGLVYKAGGFVARAQGMFRRAVELRPGHKGASAELGLQQPEAGGGGLLKRLFKRGKAS